MISSAETVIAKFYPNDWNREKPEVIFQIDHVESLYDDKFLLNFPIYL
jgi:hypothetical protein